MKEIYDYFLRCIGAFLCRTIYDLQKRGYIRGQSGISSYGVRTNTLT